MNSKTIRTIAGYALALVLCVAAVVAVNVLLPSAGDTLAADGDRRPDVHQVLGVFQNNAQVATTEVSLRRMGIYDSETRIATANPANWKIGRRACILPVDITIKYGIDLMKMTAADIQLDTAGTVTVRLPRPELVDYHVGQRTDRSEVVTMSGWLRDEVGEQTIQAVKNKVVDEVLADTVLFNTLSAEIEANTRGLFRSMLMEMGLKPVFTK